MPESAKIRAEQQADREGISGRIAATIVAGAGFLGPGSERLGKLAAEGHTPAEPDVERRIRKIVAISRIDLVVLIVVVAAEALKPGA